MKLLHLILILLTASQFSMASGQSDQEKIEELYSLVNEFSTKDIDVTFGYLDQIEFLIKDKKSEEYGKYLFEKAKYDIINDNIMESLNNHLLALQIFEAHHNDEMICSCLGNLGIVYIKTGQLNKASEYLNRALKITEILPEVKVLKIKPAVLSNLGVIAFEQKKYEESINRNKELISFAHSINNKYIEAKAYHNLAYTYEVLGKINLAIENYEKALQLKLEIKDIESSIRTYVDVAILYGQKKNFSKGDEYINKAITIAKDLHSDAMSKHANETASRYYTYKGDYEKAYTYLKTTHAIEKEMTTKEYNDYVSSIEDKFEKEKSFLLQEKQHKKNLFIAWVVAIIFFAALIIFFLLYRLSRQRVKIKVIENQKLQQNEVLLQKDIELKNKELTTSGMNLIQKNELINEVTEQLLSIYSSVGEKERKTIKSVLYDLQNADNSELWKEFELRFNQVHTEFYKTLNEKFPNLTPNERKLCAFLKLNMTSKDISSITKQSVKTIEQARFRLRKKLGLTGEDVDLRDFLENI